MHKGIVLALKQEDIISQIISCLGSEDLQLMIQSSKCLSLIASFNYGAIPSLATVITQLISILIQRHPECCLFTLSTLSSLSVSPSNRKLILSEPNLMPNIILYLYFDPQHPLLRNANTLLSHLTIDNEWACKFDFIFIFFQSIKNK